MIRWRDRLYFAWLVLRGRVVSASTTVDAEGGTTTVTFYAADVALGMRARGRGAR